MNDGVIDSNISSESAMSITPEIRSYLQVSAKWGFFLSIVGFVSIALMVVVGIFMGTMMGSMMGQMPPEFGGSPDMGLGMGLLSGSFFTIFYLALAALYFFPTLYLYRFSKKMKVALASDDQLFLSDSFKNLKSMFKFVGILTAVMIGLYLVVIVFAMIAGFAGAMM